MQYWTPYIVKYLDFPEPSLGILYSILLTISSMAGILNEKLIKHMDYRIITILSTAMLPSSLVVIGAAQTLIIVLPFLGLISTAYTMRSACILTWENKLITAEERNTVLSTLHVLTGINLTLAPTLIGVAIDLLTFPTMYLVVGGLGLTAVLFVAKAYSFKG
jgi:uncharacterized membrane protein